MSKEKPAGTGVILVTLFLAGLLEVVPLPEDLNWLRPDWLLLVLMYWVLALPHRVGVLWGFVVGLYHDVLVGTTLGQWALAYSLGAYFMLAAYKRMRCAGCSCVFWCAENGSTRPMAGRHDGRCFTSAGDAAVSRFRFAPAGGVVDPGGRPLYPPAGSGRGRNTLSR